jgi:hypothetical protein
VFWLAGAVTSIKVMAIATAGEGIEGFHVLVDTRRLTRGTALTASELWQLADQLVHYRTAGALRTRWSTE